MKIESEQSVQDTLYKKGLRSCMDGKPFCLFICVEGISQAEMLAFLFYAKATSQKLCLHKFMTTAREHLSC